MITSYDWNTLYCLTDAAGCLMEHFHVAPGSLSLYFYIAYQYILESCEIENKEKVNIIYMYMLLLNYCYEIII